MGIANGGYNNPFALVGANPNQRYENHIGIFFTNGGSAQATATITYDKPFNSLPTICPGNLTNGNSISYSNTLSYPFIYNESVNGFSVQLNAAGPLGTIGSPANLGMMFFIYGN